MKPERWAEIERLYDEILDLDPAEREARLARIADDDLRHEVASLIQAGPLPSHLSRVLSEQREELLAQQAMATGAGQAAATAPSLASPPHAFAPGDLLASRYEIVAFLGQGGMGEVYEAEDRDLGERIALKVIRLETSLAPGWIDRFRREVQLARRVTHPNVCRVFDIERHRQGERETIFLTMELVRGETLAARLKRAGRLSVSDALPIATQLCSALQAAHQAGILHRDLKCGNVMLVGSGGQVRTVVTDFGTARLMDSALSPKQTATQQSAILGTPAYMSPEQLEGKELTPASDIYSLGLVLYEMVTGVRPFHAELPWAEAMRRVKEEPKPPLNLAPEIGKNWNSTILRCLERDPDKRFASTLEVLGSLEGDTKEEFQWLRPRRGNIWKFAISVVALVLLPAAALVWKSAFFSGGSLRPSNPSRLLAVVEIENLSGDRSLDWLDNGVVELLTSDLAQSKSVGVISSERIRSLIRQRVNGEGDLPPSQAQEVAKEAQADLFASGSLLKIGQGLRLDLRVQETDSGRVLYSDKVEAENAQAIFATVDRATAAILTRLAPEEPASQPNASASLTGNIDALHAYENGVSYKDRSLMTPAMLAFRHAIELDPQFAMAHYQLASLLGFSRSADILVARHEIGLAMDLAGRLPLPRQQRLLIEATRLFFDGRIEDGDEALRIAIREFPRESQLWLDLGISLRDQWKSEESVQVLEQLVAFDPRNARAYNVLGYSYAQTGNFPKALEMAEKYAAMLPPNEPNPTDMRADVLAMSGRFEEAVAQYQKNLELHSDSFGYVSNLKLAVAYMNAGKYGLAETSARSALQYSDPRVKGAATGLLADILAARGQLDKAAARYEEASRLLSTSDPRRRFAAEWKAVEVYFEQGEPNQALNLARRFHSPWAPGFRGMAYVLLKNDAAAEREFADLRLSLIPLFGENWADRFVILDRVLAAFYAKRWQQVIAQWPQVDVVSGARLIVILGRACLAMENWEQAERYLRLVPILQRTWGSAYFTASYDPLEYALGEFYLAKVFEHAGKKVEAIHAYREFLAHFQNSRAHLPQVAEAHAALKRLL